MLQADFSRDRVHSPIIEEVSVYTLHAYTIFNKHAVIIRKITVILQSTTTPCFNVMCAGYLLKSDSVIGDEDTLPLRFRSMDYPDELRLSEEELDDAEVNIGMEDGAESDDDYKVIRTIYFYNVVVLSYLIQKETTSKCKCITLQ